MSEFVIRLTDEEKERVRDLIEGLSIDITDIDNDVLNRLQVVSFQLPTRIAEELVKFRRNPNRFGTLVFTNLPTDGALPPTPDVEEAIVKEPGGQRASPFVVYDFHGRADRVSR